MSFLLLFQMVCNLIKCQSIFLHFITFDIYTKILHVIFENHQITVIIRKCPNNLLFKKNVCDFRKWVDIVTTLKQFRKFNTIFSSILELASSSCQEPIVCIFSLKLWIYRFHVGRLKSFLVVSFMPWKWTCAKNERAGY